MTAQFVPFSALDLYDSRDVRVACGPCSGARELWMTTAPRVSVIVPTYNAATHIAATIESVLAQTFVDWELVLFDDGSTDATVAVAESHAVKDPRVRVVAGENHGVASARNSGLAATDSHSEFVVFLDHDDIWEPAFLETLVTLLDREPHLVSAHSTAIAIDVDGLRVPGDDLEDHLQSRRRVGRTGVGPTPAGAPTTFADLIYHNWIVTPGVHLIRRSRLDRVGGFDEESVPCDDWDMNLRVSRGGDIGYVARPLLRWRRHEGAQSYSARWQAAYYRTRRKAVLDTTNSPEQRRLARRAYPKLDRATIGLAFEQLRQRRWRWAARSIKRAGVGTLEYCRVVLDMRRSMRPRDQR